MRQSLPLALLAATLGTAPLLPTAIAATSDPQACVLNSSQQNIVANIRLVAANGQDLPPDQGQMLFPRMTTCRPVQAGAAVRFYITGIVPVGVAGSASFPVCTVMIGVVQGRAQLTVTGNQGDFPRCETF